MSTVSTKVTSRVALTEDQYNEKLNTMPNVFTYFGGSMTIHTFFDAGDTSKGKLERVWHRSNGHIEYFFDPEF